MSADYMWRDRGRDSADEILKRRVASGEIGVDEYEQMRRAAGGPGTPPASAA